MLFELQNVTRTFGVVKALDDIVMSVEAGERLALIGPNGSGKTTLFNVASGLLRPTGGHVRFRGNDISRVGFDATARRGLVRTFQHDAVFPSWTVEENLVLALHRRLATSDGEVPEDLDAVLMLADLQRIRGARAGSLPYGHRRRLGVAIAAALNPTLLMLDEPAAGLNARETDELAEMLGRLYEMRVTLVVVEHDMPFVEALSTRVVVLNAGRVVASGSPAEVKAMPEVIAAYLGDLDAES
jgi:ABC-type branched-subunit amino acid transport system ATPase component